MSYSPQDVQNGGWLAQALRRGGAPRWGMNPGRLDPAAIHSTLRWADPLIRLYFRPTVTGFANIPPAPVMLVSNHSGGTSIPDVWPWLLLWYERFGTVRPIHPVAHEIVLATRHVGRYLETRGVLRADEKVALETLTKWRRDLLVMPGGDLDTWRPYRDRYRVRFGGRTGYARLALKAGVPIVPVAMDGAHATLIVLTDGRRIAKAINLPKLARAEVWPIHLSLPWGIAFGPLPHIPVPTRMRYRIAEPIWAPVDAPEGWEPTEEEVREHDYRVRLALQKELDVLARRRGQMRARRWKPGLTTKAAPAPW